MAKRVAAATTTKKKAAAGGAAAKAKAKRAAGGTKNAAGGAAAKAAGKTKPAAAKATSARKKPATAPAAAPRAALGGGGAAASRATKLPAAALAPDVTRHDVNWGAKGARRHEYLAVSRDGAALTCTSVARRIWADAHKRPCRVRMGAGRGVRDARHALLPGHRQAVRVRLREGRLGRPEVADRQRSDIVGEFGPGSSSSPASGATFVPDGSSRDGGEEHGPGDDGSPASGAVFMPAGYFDFGTAPLSDYKFTEVPKVKCPCKIGCLLDADAGAMTVFVNGKPLKQQCEYRFPSDGLAWYPSVGLGSKDDALFSNSV
jgi:hypothetical protein